jgi:hypothetical protein
MMAMVVTKSVVLKTAIKSLTGDTLGRLSVWSMRQKLKPKNLKRFDLNPIGITK